MKKHILAIAAAIVVAGTITFIACNKDNDTNQIVNPSYVSAKGGMTLEQLRNAMVAYYAACDRAYQDDSTTFLSVCANSDMTNFLTITGLTSEAITDYQTLALSENEDYINKHPNLIKEVIQRFSCQEYPLPRLGKLASQTNGHLSALIPESAVEINRDHLNSIIYACRCDNPHIMAARISSSLSYMAKRQLSSMLNVFWRHCDYAYVNSPTLLKGTCEKEDHNLFYEVTKLSQDFFDELIGLANVSYSEFIEDNPDYDFTGNGDTCSKCQQPSLIEIWYRIADIHSVSDKIKEYAPDYFDTVVYMLPPIDPCIKWCTNLQPRNHDREQWCYLDCTMERNLLKIQQVLMMFEYAATH
ncbi:MAG: hypothetical protein J6I49_09185 [Bacteroidales bacterium]|nr:hypothetical protein [Bacteroidales bacterium]